LVFGLLRGLVHDRTKLFQVVLAQEGAGPGGSSLFAVIGRIVLRQDDDAGRGELPKDFPGGGEAIHLRHLHIHDRPVRTALRINAERFRSVVALDHFDGRSGQKIANDLAEGDVVVHHEAFANWLRLRCAIKHALSVEEDPVNVYGGDHTNGLRNNT